MMMRMSQVKVGARVTFRQTTLVGVCEDREGQATAGPVESSAMVPEGASGVVVSAHREVVRVVLDPEFRATLPVDEVRWDAAKYSMPKVASASLEFIGQEECPKCGSQALDSDYKRSVWSIFCPCGTAILEEDVSEAALARFKAGLEEDEDLLKQIQAILGDSSSDWCGCMEGELEPVFHDKRRTASLRLLALVNTLRGKAEA